MGEQKRPSGAISRRERQIGAILFMGIGLITVLSQVALNVYTALLRLKTPTVPSYEVNHWVLSIGALLGFVGFGIFNLDGAIRGGTFVSDVALDFVSLVRTGKIADRAGRRATDPLVVPSSTTPAAPPSSEKHDGP